MRTVVVTGGAGFIGSHLVEELCARDYRVRVLDDLSTGSEQNLAAVRNRVEFYHGQVQDPELCREVCEGADSIIHLAARVSIMESLRRPLLTNESNVTGTLAALCAARDAGVRRFIFASSASVYGQSPRVPQTTGLPLQPASPYAASKAAGEHYTRVFGMTLNSVMTIL